MPIEGRGFVPEGAREEVPTGVAEHREAVVKNLKSTKRFADRMPDVKKLMTDIVRWSKGEDLSSDDVKENYPGWTQKDFEQVVAEADLDTEAED